MKRARRSCLQSMLVVGATCGSLHAQFAVEVVDYERGEGGSDSFSDPTAALGEPTRFSGSMMEPSVVSPFQPAWRSDELVTIGAGGHLVLAFEEPVRDEPTNPFGVDLIIFGNAFFTNFSQDSPCVSTLYEEGGLIEVSADGIDFVLIEGVSADGLYPTLGFLDADPLGMEPGDVHSDFTRPVDPALADWMLAGACWDDMLSAYDGSGGGTPIDLADTGLTEIRFVRISTLSDALVLPEIDGIADVAPEAATADLNHDGRVDGEDLTLLLADWNLFDSPWDLDGDNVITGKDLVLLLGGWT
ncbi:MAG: hypothetical protein P8J45_13410 [Phycisphaerales bacterium]|nr:hypothetical protein [Phycisphaerales bacterium]